MRRLHPLTVVAAPLVATIISLGVPAGVALANRNEVTATCRDGLVFAMDRGEAGTEVTAFLDGARVAGPFTVAAQNDALYFAVPAPADETVPHSWTVVVDSLYNQDQTIVRLVPACDTATTIPAATTAPSTTVPPPSSTVPPSSSTTTPVPTASTTVVTTPRPTTTTLPSSTTSVPTSFLPATGSTVDVLAAVAAFALGAGGVLLAARRRVGGAR